MDAKRRIGVVMLAALFPVPPASACPLCASERAAEVRAGLFDDQLTSKNVLITALPFAVLGALVAGVHFGIGAKAVSAAGPRAGTS